MQTLFPIVVGGKNRGTYEYFRSRHAWCTNSFSHVLLVLIGPGKYTWSVFSIFCNDTLRVNWRETLPGTVDVSISLFQRMHNGMFNIFCRWLPSTCGRNTRWMWSNVSLELWNNRSHGIGIQSQVANLSDSPRPIAGISFSSLSLIFGTLIDMTSKSSVGGQLKSYNLNDPLAGIIASNRGPGWTGIRPEISTTERLMR